MLVGRIKMRYFNEDGNLKDKYQVGTDSYGEEIITAEDEAVELVESGKVKANTDAARIYYARVYSTVTKGNYGVVTMYSRAWE